MPRQTPTNKSRNTRRRANKQAIASDRLHYSMPARRSASEAESVTGWETKGLSRNKSVQLLSVPWFSTRGMQCVYGRGDYFPISNRRYLRCEMSVWLRKDGRVFVRFDSPRKTLDLLS